MATSANTHRTYQQVLFALPPKWRTVSVFDSCDSQRLVGVVPNSRFIRQYLTFRFFLAGSAPLRDVLGQRVVSRKDAKPQRRQVAQMRPKDLVEEEKESKNLKAQGP